MTFLPQIKATRMPLGVSLACGMALSGCVQPEKYPSADYDVNGMAVRVSYHESIVDPQYEMNVDPVTGGLESVLTGIPFNYGYGVTRRDGGKITEQDGDDAGEAIAYFCKEQGKKPSGQRFIPNGDGPPLWHFECVE